MSLHMSSAVDDARVGAAAALEDKDFQSEVQKEFMNDTLHCSWAGAVIVDPITGQV